VTKTTTVVQLYIAIFLDLAIQLKKPMIINNIIMVITILNFVTPTEVQVNDNVTYNGTTSTAAISGVLTNQ